MNPAKLTFSPSEEADKMTSRDKRRALSKVKTEIRDMETDILISLFEQRANLPELEERLHELRAQREELYSTKTRG